MSSGPSPRASDLGHVGRAPAALVQRDRQLEVLGERVLREAADAPRAPRGGTPRWCRSRTSRRGRPCRGRSRRRTAPAAPTRRAGDAVGRARWRSTAASARTRRARRPCGRASPRGSAGSGTWSQSSTATNWRVGARQRVVDVARLGAGVLRSRGCSRRRGGRPARASRRRCRRRARRPSRRRRAAASPPATVGSTMSTGSS